MGYVHFIYFTTKCNVNFLLNTISVTKVLRLKLDLPRHKDTINKTFISFKKQNAFKKYCD